MNKIPFLLDSGQFPFEPDQLLVTAAPLARKGIISQQPELIAPTAQLPAADAEFFADQNIGYPSSAARFKASRLNSGLYRLYRFCLAIRHLPAHYRAHLKVSTKPGQVLIAEVHGSNVCFSRKQNFPS